jgi:hypothetical protein
MDGALVTGLSGQVIRPFIAASLVLNTRTVYLVDGGGQVTFGGNTYTGSDDELGSVAAMAEVSDEIAVEEMGWQMVLAGTTFDGVQELIDATYTGRVTVYLGALNDATGLPIGEPDMRFSGFLEPVQEAHSMGQYAVTLDFSSAWSKLLRANEGQRLNGPFHELAWPGELGLEYTHGLKTFQAPAGVFIGNANYDSGGNAVIGQQDR